MVTLSLLTFTRDKSPLKWSNGRKSLHSKANKVTFVRTCNFTKTNTPPWLFYTLLKLYKCYQIGFTLGKIQHSLNNYQLVRDIKTLKVIIIKLLLKFNLYISCKNVLLLLLQYSFSNNSDRTLLDENHVYLLQTFIYDAKREIQYGCVIKYPNWCKWRVM